MKKKRQANFELLRITAMLMIIALHYLVKGNLAAYFTDNDNAVTCFAWLVEAFCIVAVNCYVLISGYFLVESEWKPGRVVSLLCQVLFYSLLVPVVCIGVGIVPAGSIGFYDWFEYLFPVSTEHYWFVTAYLLMYLFAPFLAAGVCRMEKRQLQIAAGVLLFFFSVIKSVIPVSFVTDKSGYDFGWFLCLFVVAGYIRRFGIPWLEKKSHAVILYIVMSVAIWGLAGLSHVLGYQIAAFVFYENMPYTYNHIFCFVGAVALFYVFKDSAIESMPVSAGEKSDNDGMSGKRGRLADAVCRLSPYTFGVYLLHEHILLRYDWMQWLGVSKVAGRWSFIPHMVCSVFLVYGVGTAVDYIRAQLFVGIGKLIGKRHSSERKKSAGTEG